MAQSTTKTTKKTSPKTAQNDTLAMFAKSKRKVDGDFISYILSAKRKNIPDFTKIKDSFKKDSSFFDWYYTDYLPVYNKELSRITSNIETADELVKIFPLLAPWVLRDKGTELGKVPQDFMGKKTFLYILDVILESAYIAQLKRIKSLEVSGKLAAVFPQETAGKDLSNLDVKKNVLQGIIQDLAGEDFIIPKHGTEYLISPLCNVLTKKAVFKISINDSTYILKLSYNNNLHVTTDSADEQKSNQLIRPDSPYMNAIADFYLWYNKCKNAPHICYYNMDYDAVLYKVDFVEPFILNDESEIQNPCRFNRKYLHDANLLGIFMNDLNAANFMIDTKTDTLKIIDSGHISYSNPANPGLVGLSLSFGNLCGKDMVSTFCSLYL